MRLPQAYSAIKLAVNASVDGEHLQLATPLDFHTWLPFAAKTYKISARIEDYVLRKIPLCPSDIPNRNGIAFPISELVRYQPPPTNRQVYKAWAGCPVHCEHKNENPEDAYGVILDTSLTRITGFNQDRHWKVMGLIAVDKVKHPEMAQRVLDGDLTTGSMGALAESFSCSVCGAPAYDKENAFRNCSHITSIADVNWRILSESGQQKLAFLNAHGITPTEYSLVEDPAWCMSLSSDVFTL